MNVLHTVHVRGQCMRLNIVLSSTSLDVGCDVVAGTVVPCTCNPCRQPGHWLL